MQWRQHMNALAKTLIVVAIIGALNWGLIGFFNFNLVDAIFAGGSHVQTSTAARVVYAIVGVCGLASLAMLPKLREEGTVGHRHGPHGQPA